MGRLGIIEDRAHRYGARARIELIVDEIEAPFVRKAVLPFQPHFDRNAGLAIERHLSFVDRPTHAERRALVDFAIGVDRVQRHDAGQDRLILGDDIAKRHIVAAHLADDRGEDLRVSQVQLVQFQARLRSAHGGIRLVHGGLVLVELLKTHRASSDFECGLVPRVVRLGQFRSCLVEVQLPLGLVKLRLIWPRIDLGQLVSHLHFRTFSERQLHQIAGDPRTNVHRVDGIGPACKNHVLGNVPPQWRADRHRELGRRCGLPWLSHAPARGDHQGQPYAGNCKPQSPGHSRPLGSIDVVVLAPAFPLSACGRP